MENLSYGGAPEKADVAVIGGGIIGLAVSRRLAIDGREVFLFEAEDDIGQHSSSRGSEVIHSGIYYPTNSLKARLCVAGQKQLYEYCDQQNIKYRQLGKILVATSDEEIPVLENLKKQAEANGVSDLQWLSSDEVTRLEPEIRCVRGFLSPSTGIVDSHALLQSLRMDGKKHGVNLFVATPVERGEVVDEGVMLTIGGPEPSQVICRLVVNCAGLYAQKVARSIAGLSQKHIPTPFYAKGHYFTLAGQSPFSHLVYPVPEKGGLGIHLTLDLSGKARFGPDVVWIDTVDYSFDESRADACYSSVRRYYPSLADGALSPGHTGIRPKLSKGDSVEKDFIVQGPKVHGVSGLYNTFGFDSPGLTASLAFADYFGEEVQKMNL